MFQKFIDNAVMRTLSEEMVTRILSLAFIEKVSTTLFSLDRDKNYILIIPDTVDEQELAKALDDFSGQVNLLVIRANRASLIEVI